MLAALQRASARPVLLSRSFSSSDLSPLMQTEINPNLDLYKVACERGQRQHARLPPRSPVLCALIRPQHAIHAADLAACYAVQVLGVPKSADYPKIKAAYLRKVPAWP